MKQAYKLFSILFLMMAFAIPFTSCSDDKDEPAGDATHDGTLFGSWKSSWTEGKDSGWDTFTFNADGTGKYAGEETYNNKRYSFSAEFNWTSEQGTLTLDITSSDDSDYPVGIRTMTYEIKGNSLYLDGYMDEPYVKQ